MEIDMKSPDGNAFAIMGHVRRLLIDVGRGDEWPKIRKRMMSGGYNNLCETAADVTNGAITVVNRT